MPVLPIASTEAGLTLRDTHVVNACMLWPADSAARDEYLLTADSAVELFALAAELPSDERAGLIQGSNLALKRVEEINSRAAKNIQLGTTAGLMLKYLHGAAATDRLNGAHNTAKRLATVNKARRVVSGMLKDFGWPSSHAQTETSWRRFRASCHLWAAWYDLHRHRESISIDGHLMQAFHVETADGLLTLLSVSEEYRSFGQAFVVGGSGMSLVPVIPADAAWIPPSSLLLRRAQIRQRSSDWAQNRAKDKSIAVR